MALDLRDLHLERPRRRDRRLASTRQLVLPDRELVTLARSDHELPSPVFANLASERIFEKAVP
jgi:hypothetical protein